MLPLSLPGPDVWKIALHDSANIVQALVGLTILVALPMAVVRARRRKRLDANENEG
jgi:hypothetical protein